MSLVSFKALVRRCAKCAVAGRLENQQGELLAEAPDATNGHALHGGVAAGAKKATGQCGFHGASQVEIAMASNLRAMPSEPT